MSNIPVEVLDADGNVVNVVDGSVSAVNTSKLNKINPASIVEAKAQILGAAVDGAGQAARGLGENLGKDSDKFTGQAWDGLGKGTNRVVTGAADIGVDVAKQVTDDAGRAATAVLRSGSRLADAGTDYQIKKMNVRADNYGDVYKRSSNMKLDLKEEKIRRKFAQQDSSAISSVIMFGGLAVALLIWVFSKQFAVAIAVGIACVAGGGLFLAFKK